MQIRELSLLAKTACRSYTAEETAIWNLTVLGTEVPQGLPFGPNARNASLEAKPAKEMLKTLAKEPEKFILYNSGIMIIVDQIAASRVEGGDFKVRLQLYVPTTEDEGD